MADLDVVIVTYRSEAYMPRLLSDLKDMSSLSHSLQIFDNTANAVTLTAAWNDLWRSGSSPVVAFLNPDIYLSPEWDARLVGCLRDRADVAISMGNRYIPNGGGLGQQWMAGLAKQLGATPSYKDLGEHLEGFYAVVVKREALEALRGFDERFRFYFQDSDLQLRCLRVLGKQTVQVNHCPIWHIGMVSTREAVQRGELDREEELRHVDWVRAALAERRLRPWHDLSDADRAAVRLDPMYGKLPRRA
jgi:GT2 family glycosyltransferase